MPVRKHQPAVYPKQGRFCLSVLRHVLSFFVAAYCTAPQFPNFHAMSYCSCNESFALPIDHLASILFKFDTFKLFCIRFTVLVSKLPTRCFQLITHKTNHPSNYFAFAQAIKPSPDIQREVLAKQYEHQTAYLHNVRKVRAPVAPPRRPSPIRQQPVNLPPVPGAAPAPPTIQQQEAPEAPQEETAASQELAIETES